MINTATVYQAFYDLGIQIADAAQALENASKREVRYRNRQNDGKHEYQPVSQAGKDFYNLRQMYAGFSD